MTSKIQNAINKYSLGRTATISQPVLPLMHSTTCENAENILENNLLSATHCGVFGTDLLYFFYGKPAYRVSSKISDHHILLPLAVLFLTQRKLNLSIFSPLTREHLPRIGMMR